MTASTNTNNVTDLKAKMDELYAEYSMKPEISQCSNILVMDGDMGIFVVDAMDFGITHDLAQGVSHDVEDLDQDLKQSICDIYEEMTTSCDVHELTSVSGYLYRLSMSGYMDSTDYNYSLTEEEAMKELIAAA